ncbi:MAG: hypothetical protein ACKV19_04520 [Verrucomicrobiales bacterium]
MNIHFSLRRHLAGYSLIELTLATSVLAAGVAAAASLTLSSAHLEEMNHRKSRIVALNEASARLWQLGLSPTQVATIVPGDPALANITFNAGSTVPTDQGNPVADPSTDLGSFEQMTIETAVLMRESSSPTAGDGQSQALQPLVLIR